MLLLAKLQHLYRFLSRPLELLENLNLQWVDIVSSTVKLVTTPIKGIFIILHGHVNMETLPMITLDLLSGAMACNFSTFGHDCKSRGQCLSFLHRVSRQ